MKTYGNIRKARDGSNRIVWDTQSSTLNSISRLLTDALENGHLNRSVEFISIENIPAGTVVGVATVNENDMEVSTLVIDDPIIEKYGKLNTDEA